MLPRYMGDPCNFEVRIDMKGFEKRRNQTTPLLFSLPVLICIVVYMILPLLINVVLAFTNFSLQNLNNIEGTTRFIGIDNFLSLWGGGRLLRMIGRTFIWMAGSLVFSILLGVLFATVLTFDIKGKNIMKAVVLMPWVLPEVITGYVMRWMFVSEQGILWSVLVKMGLLSPDSRMLSDPTIAMALVIFANVWRAAPYVAIMVYGKLKSLPQNQIEAARIDGANAVQSFVYVTVPWVWPIVKRCALLLFVWSFNAYSIIYTMTSGGPANATMILPLALRNMAFGQYAFGKGSAYGMITLLILLICMLIMSILFRISRVIYRKVRRRA